MRMISLAQLSVVSILAVYCGAAATAQEKAQQARVVASDYPDLQAAVNALPNRTGEVYLPAGRYVLEKTLDLSYPPGGYQGGIKLAGAGRMTKIVCKTRGQPAIDLTGANHCVIENLNIEAENVKPEEAPNIGLLLARNVDGAAAQEHRFSNVNIIGYFSLANVYNITSELDRFIGCIFINTAPGSHNLVWSSDNFADVKSPYRGNIRTIYSNTELRVIGCSFYNWGGGQNGSNIHMRGFTMDATVRDCYMNPPKGGNAVYLGMSSKGGPVRDAIFEGIRIEGENASDIFRIEGRAENIAIRNCTIIYGEGTALNAEQADYLTFQNNDVWNVRGWKLALQISQMHDSRIAANMFTYHNWDGKNPQEGPEMVIRGARGARCSIETPRRDMVDFKDLEGTVIEALNEGPARRHYLGTHASGVVLNLTPVDTAAIKGARAGDIALDNGANTASGKPGLAVHDGKEWVYMN